MYCTFAPSVSDGWQGFGIATKMLQFIVYDLKINYEIRRILFWGGVQANNYKTVNYYINNGFKTLGKFSYEGENLDMYLNI